MLQGNHKDTTKQVNYTRRLTLRRADCVPCFLQSFSLDPNEFQRQTLKVFLIFAFCFDHFQSTAVLAFLEDPSNKVMLGEVNIWEILNKLQLGKFILRLPPKEILVQQQSGQPEPVYRRQNLRAPYSKNRPTFKLAKALLEEGIKSSIEKWTSMFSVSLYFS